MSNPKRYKKCQKDKCNLGPNGIEKLARQDFGKAKNRKALLGQLSQEIFAVTLA